MIEICECPFSNEIKGDLIRWFELQKTKEVSGYTLQTKEYNEPNTPEIKKLFDWIESVIVEVVDKLSNGSNSLYSNLNRWQNKNFKIDAYWGLYYNSNSYVTPHSHFPHAISFGYYINVPEGSSPFTLIINQDENKNYFPQEGQLFVFDSSIKHTVNPTPVAGRTVIAGAIAYLSRFSN